MSTLSEILKIFIPAAMVFAASFFLVKRFLDNEQRRREHELKITAQALITPLKIQAYERIIIFLERINPNTLVVRVNKNNMNSRQLHLDLVSAVKTEYEHNLSQLIYISPGAWQFVKTAKEEIIQLINISSSKVSSDANSSELAIMILNIAANLEKKLPSELAIEFIKKEISQSF